MKVNLFENEDKWSGKIDNWHFEWFCEKVIYTCYDNQDHFIKVSKSISKIYRNK